MLPVSDTPPYSIRTGLISIAEDNVVTIEVGRVLTCKLCGYECAQLLWETFVAHIEGVHHYPFARTAEEQETPAIAVMRFLDRYPYARDCLNCWLNNSPWSIVSGAD